MISYRIAFNNALYNGEFAWVTFYQTPSAQHYERCITAIVHYCYTSPIKVRYCQDPVERGYTDNLIVLLSSGACTQR